MIYRLKNLRDISLIAQTRSSDQQQAGHNKVKNVKYQFINSYFSILYKYTLVYTSEVYLILFTLNWLYPSSLLLKLHFPKDLEADNKEPRSIIVGNIWFDINEKNCL
jgi:hypothetical protein